MSEAVVKIVEAFYQAKRINHYYWMHTPHESVVMRIENVQKIIQYLSQVTIEKFEVDTPSDFHRAFVERYGPEGKDCKIYVISSESLSWKRFSTVKELCHILLDAIGDFQADPRKTIHCIKDTTSILDDQLSPEAVSERLAEIIALELIYPLEHRREDREALASGSTPEQIAEKRILPTKYVYMGVDETHFDACTSIWNTLKDVTPPTINEMVQ